VPLIPLLASGCTGHGRVHIVPLGLKKIDTTGPLVAELKPDECYFWVRNEKELCIAMRQFSGSLLGNPLEREFIMSLVVDGLPAAQSRDYRMDRCAARVRQRAGYSHFRSGSTSGILAVWDYGHDRLRGRFRFMARMQTYSALTGWSGNNTVLLTGEFRAVRDELAGRAILERTEEGAMSRDADVTRAGRAHPTTGLH